MAEVAYIFGDILTGQVIAEIRCQGVSMKMDLAGGEWRGTINLDRTGTSNEVLTSATIPGRCFVVVERDGSIIGDYILWTRTYQSQAKVLQLYGRTWRDYTNSRVIREDLAFEEVDQVTIFTQLYDLMQSDPNSLQVVVPSFTPSGITRSLEVSAAEFKTFGQVLDAIADGENGFDWVVDTSKQSGAYVRTLRLGYPAIGATEANIVFEYQSPEDGQPGGGNVINYWSNESMGSAGTHLYALGSGEGESMLTAEVIHNDLIAGGFPRYDVDTSHKDIDNAQTLVDVALAEAAVRKPAMPVLTVEVKADAEPVFGSYAVGDMVRIEFLDPMHPLGFRRETRLLGWEYYPPEDSNVEYARLTFEGEEL